MIKVEIKNKNFDDFVLKNIEFTLKEGKILGILGKSGSGKSTILNIIAGLEKNFEGNIKVRDKIGMVFQNDLLLPHLNLYENIAFGIKFGEKNKKIVDKKVRDIIKKLELEGKEERYPNELSGGERQRCSIGRALVGETKILLMDEAFSALDYNLKNEMYKLIKDLCQKLNLTVIFITHDREEAFYLADEVLILSEGEMIEYNTLENLYYFPKKKYSAKLLGVENIYSNDEFWKLSDIRLNSEFVGIRSEDIKIVDYDEKGIEIEVVEMRFCFGGYSIIGKKDGIEIKVKTNNNHRYIVGEKLKITFCDGKILELN